MNTFFHGRYLVLSWISILFRFWYLMQMARAWYIFKTEKIDDFHSFWICLITSMMEIWGISCFLNSPTLNFVWCKAPKLFCLGVFKIVCSVLLPFPRSAVAWAHPPGCVNPSVPFYCFNDAYNPDWEPLGLLASHLLKSCPKTKFFSMLVPATWFSYFSDIYGKLPSQLNPHLTCCAASKLSLHILASIIHHFFFSFRKLEHWTTRKVSYTTCQ